MLVRPDEDVAARVRSALGGRSRPHAPPGGPGTPYGPDGLPARAGAAARRARRERRRAAGGAVVAVVVTAAVVVGAAALVPALRGAPPASGGPGAPLSSVPLGRASLLDLDEVSVVVPGASSRAPGADVTPPTAGGYPRARYRGGWCGDAVLLDAPAPEQVWAAEWQQQGLAGTVEERGPDGAVREVVMRWSDAAGARAWAEATRASPTRCRDPRGAPFPPTAYRPWTVATSVTSLTSSAVAPAGPTGDAADAGVPVWRVRAVHAEGPTVVDLTVVLRESDAGEAVRSVAALLEAAAGRAAADAGGGRA